MNRSFPRHPEEGGGVGGERRIPSRSPEGRFFGATHEEFLWVGLQCIQGRITIDSRRKHSRKDPCSSSLSSSPWLHGCSSLSVLPTSLVMGGAVCWLKPIQNIVDSTLSAYCKWIHFYCGYCNGAQMINVNKEAFPLAKAQWR